jgi:hypothetical protein
MIDNPALDWGVHIDRVEIKDVALPESMKRSIARQAEAERERRSRVITAEGELQASETLAQAAEVMTAHPAALQLRLLQTVVEVAAEKNSTLVLPFPVELLRFLERATPPEVAAAAASPEAIATSPPASTDGLVEGRQHDEASEMPALSSQPTTAPVPASRHPPSPADETGAGSRVASSSQTTTTAPPAMRWTGPPPRPRLMSASPRPSRLSLHKTGPPVAVNDRVPNNRRANHACAISVPGPTSSRTDQKK